MTLEADIRKFKEYVVGVSLLTTFKPVGVVHFKSWKQYKSYKNEIRGIMDDFNRKWAKVKVGKQGRMLINLNDKLDRTSDKWRRKLGIYKKKSGAKKLKKVS